jgi:putative transposase
VHRCAVVQGFPVSGGDHQPLRLAVPPVPAQLPRNRRDDVAARDRGLSHETVRQWCAKFGQTYANALRRRRARPGDKWHLDEVFIKINGKIHYLWRAVDQHGNVLDIGHVPRVLVTDKLASYGVAHRRLMPRVEHRRSKYLNNRAENSHQPTRQRERAMKRFTSPGRAQRFLSAFSGISPHFRPGRHRFGAEEYRREMADRFTTWNPGHRHGHGGLTRAPQTDPPNPAMPVPPDNFSKLTVPTVQFGKGYWAQRNFIARFNH